MRPLTEAGIFIGCGDRQQSMGVAFIFITNRFHMVSVSRSMMGVSVGVQRMGGPNGVK